MNQTHLINWDSNLCIWKKWRFAVLLISLTSTGTGYGDELVEVLLSRPLLLPRSGDCSLAAEDPGESWPAAAPHPPGTVYSETRGACAVMTLG